MTPRDSAAKLHAAQEDLHAQLRQFLDHALRPSDIRVSPHWMTYQDLADNNERFLRQCTTLAQGAILLLAIALAPLSRARVCPIECVLAAGVLAIVGIPAVPLFVGRYAFKDRYIWERRYALRRATSLDQLSAPALSLSFDAIQEVKRLLLVFDQRPRSVAEFRHTALGILRNPSFPRHLAFADLALGWMKRLSDAAILERWPNLTPPDVVVYEPGDRPDTPPNGGPV